MPPRKVPTNQELAKRIEVLERRSIKVGDLPIAALRRELAKEPQNAAEILLPHSITKELLKE